MNSLKDVEGVSISELDYNDIIRSDVVARILQKLNKYVAGPPLRGTIL